MLTLSKCYLLYHFSYLTVPFRTILKFTWTTSVLFGTTLYWFGQLSHYFGQHLYHLGQPFVLYWTNRVLFRIIAILFSTNTALLHHSRIFIGPFRALFWNKENQYSGQPYHTSSKTHLSLSIFVGMRHFYSSWKTFVVRTSITSKLSLSYFCAKKELIPNEKWSSRL